MGREQAQKLAHGRAVAGRVALGRSEHWYRVEIPEGANTLTLDLGGEPTVLTALSAETEAGEPLLLRPLPGEEAPHLERFQVQATPGETIYLKVEEPPRNVLFLWDTSGSVAGYQTAIYNTLNAYVAGLVPGRDAANLLPFGRSRPLLQDWYGDPYVVHQVLNDYPRGDDSSAAETALAVAARALAPRAGSKAIVVVTDASTTRDAALWVELDEARPRVFALGVPSAGSLVFGPQREQDLMQDWARVNGGHYTDVRDAGEMEVAFARTTVMLRRPAGYTLRAEASFEESPRPGLLRVVGDVGQDAPARGAVELILDASGSMLKRLGDERRIDVAGDVVVAAICERIPAGTALALRVFGHREANACRTDLEIPLAPLDPDTAIARVREINAKNLARTPIADSLARVEADLSGAEGKKLVVLVTDGEETCDGDPAAAIERLNQSGLEVSVNIVGFALDDPELEDTFAAWAERGGGRYFSARDRQGLNTALGKALEVAYAVYDHSGTLVAEGAVNGEPVELAAGDYRVVLLGSPPRTFTEVVVEGEEDSILDLDKTPFLGTHGGGEWRMRRFDPPIDSVKRKAGQRRVGSVSGSHAEAPRRAARGRACLEVSVRLPPAS